MDRDTISIYFLLMLSFDSKEMPIPGDRCSVNYSVEILYILFPSGRFVVYLFMEIFEKSYIEKTYIPLFPHLTWLIFFSIKMH